MTVRRHPLALFLAGAMLIAGCAMTASSPQVEWRQLHGEVQTATADFVRRDPSLRPRFDNAYGYAIFPSLGDGETSGWGEVYEQGQLIGYATFTAGTRGSQLDGPTSGIVIFFEDERALRHFTTDGFTLPAEVSAVAATRGASLDAMYEDGLLVFTKSRGGVMVEAPLGGQGFRFVPVDEVEK